MVAIAASQSSDSFRGARPIDYRIDLNGVAHLLEECFRPEHTFPFSNSPLLRELGVFLWMLNYVPAFPETLEGFVWMENGRLVGNVSLNCDRSGRCYISNVAVKPEFRRQGIARALMQATLNHIRTQEAKTAFLNVRPQNEGAVKLYTDLGFKSLETCGEWKLPALPIRPIPHTLTGYRPPLPSDYAPIADLYRAATPEHPNPYRLPRSEFRLTWDDSIIESVTDFFVGQATRRWALERDGKLAAMLTVRGQRMASVHHIGTIVAPDCRGKVENDLVAFALEQLEQFPDRAIRAAGTSAHPEWTAALERQGFQFLNGLTLMEITF
jgi:GNAT superfamily N-acetyltransferase